ncbi:hypothetical protein O6H91_Y418700 [Diphasiastrum complanatum]|nr:hypothetical protein O6H91_Y418700 [Diphasiastrum complanatum]
MLNQKSRAPFVAFLQLLLLHHPSERCRKGSAAILTSLENTWPISSNFEDITPEGRMPDSAGPLPDLEALQKRKICGNGLPKGSWISCRGSRNDTRGYSCGLWLLFHSLSTRVDDTESSAAFEAMHEFISHFFACEDCRKHFLQLSSRAKMEIVSRRDLVLWFWRAHNEVNIRVSSEDAAAGNGDPKFPKGAWPPKDLCSSCRLSAGLATSENTPNWNESAIYSFLLSFYGRIIPAATDANEGSTGKEIDHSTLDLEEIASSSSVSVPVGAAIGIAMASCGFGIVACYWRMQQKRRKLLRRRV